MSGPTRHLAVFAHERTDARVLKRLRAFADHGWKVTALTFHRPRPGRTTTLPCPNIDLGETQDRAYGRRALALVRALGILWRERALLRSVDAVYAINTDNALLALAVRFIAGQPLPIFLEIADIQPPFVGAGIKGSLIRWIERGVLARTTALVTTSPGFIREYFSPLQKYSGRTILLENKIYPSTAVTPPANAAPPPGPPWRIGWFGALRCQASWDAIRALARRHPDTLHFSIRGYPTAIDADAFLSQVGTEANIEFGGAYEYPDDLPAMHAGLHFVWGFDFSDATANSRWLLPNRLYESGLFLVTMLAAAGTETGRRLAESSTGAALEVDAVSLADGVSAFFDSLTPQAWLAWRSQILALPRSTFTGELDYEALSTEIARACKHAST